MPATHTLSSDHLGEHGSGTVRSATGEDASSSSKDGRGSAWFAIGRLALDELGCSSRLDWVRVNSGKS